MLRVELVKSIIGNNVRNRRTVAALGLRKMHQVVEHKDNPVIRGMIHHVQHMVKVEVVPDEPVKAPKKATKKKVEETPSETE
jgi:large subunit ribosomal protein L30